MLNKIPERKKYNGTERKWIRQSFGQDSFSFEYFTYAGIFLHFWGLFEWLIANRIWENKTRLMGYKKWGTNFRTAQGQLDKLNSAEEVFYKRRSRLFMNGKLTLLSRIYPTLSNKIKSSQELRNIMDHNNIHLMVNMGAWQFDYGWIHQKHDEKETVEHRKIYERAKISNSKITLREINLKIYTTYSVIEIKKEIKNIISVIKYLSYDVGNDKIYQLVTRKYSLL